MIYCNLKGGLGNMLFQIAATMEFASKSGVDFSFPNLIQHLSYIKREQTFNPNLKCVKHYERLFRNLKNVQPQSGIKKINFPFQYVDWQIPKDCVIDGYFQSEKYFKNCRENILNMFDFQPKRDMVSIHVRHGDYLKNPSCHNVLVKEYYDKAISCFPEDNFLIFSDDMDWCRSTFTGDRFKFHEGENDLDDMLSMSSCKHNIIANSSFSWWGAWLNRNEDKKVFCPSQWVGTTLSHLYTKDIYCQNWIII